jgi:hypothetical protein
MLLIVFFHYITSSAFQQYLKLSNFCLGLKHVFQLLKTRQVKSIYFATHNVNTKNINKIVI